MCSFVMNRCSHDLLQWQWVELHSGTEHQLVYSLYTTATGLSTLYELGCHGVILQESSYIYNITGGHFVLTFVNNMKTNIATGIKLQIRNRCTMANIFLQVF